MQKFMASNGHVSPAEDLDPKQITLEYVEKMATLAESMFPRKTTPASLRMYACTWEYLKMILPYCEIQNPDEFKGLAVIFRNDMLPNQVDTLNADGEVIHSAHLI